jgi:hypothetical protein
MAGGLGGGQESSGIFNMTSNLLRKDIPQFLAGRRPSGASTSTGTMLNKLAGWGRGGLSTMASNPLGKMLSAGDAQAKKEQAAFLKKNKIFGGGERQGGLLGAALSTKAAFQANAAAKPEDHKAADLEAEEKALEDHKKALADQIARQKAESPTNINAKKEAQDELLKLTEATTPGKATKADLDNASRILQTAQEHLTEALKGTGLEGKSLTSLPGDVATNASLDPIKKHEIQTLISKVNDAQINLAKTTQNSS